jgi:hemerythrin-like metal-binding protein
LESKSWQDWLDLKIPSIDKEHRNLFELMGQLSEEINLNKGDKALGQILKTMREYSQYHFDHEEKLFNTHKYPDQRSHILAHQSYTAKVKEFEFLYDSGEFVDPTLVLLFLKNWWTNHIRKEDTSYTSFMIDRGVK